MLIPSSGHATGPNSRSAARKKSRPLSAVGHKLDDGPGGPPAAAGLDSLSQRSQPHCPKRHAVGHAGFDELDDRQGLAREDAVGVAAIAACVEQAELVSFYRFLPHRIGTQNWCQLILHSELVSAHFIESSQDHGNDLIEGRQPRTIDEGLVNHTLKRGQ